jgi:putative phage-type endonuclease
MLATEQAVALDVAYLSPEWYETRRQGIAASEIAAVLGISPWVSPFDLWWLKRTGADSQPENAAMRRGHRYEALILEDFAEEHPEFTVVPTTLIRNRQRAWQMATPDSLAYEAGYAYADPDADDTEPLAVVQAKTGQRWEWGEPGTDDIPVHYRAQVLWEMDTVGVNVAYLPVMFGDSYNEYVMEYDELDVKFMRQRAEEFLASVRADRQPDVDDSTATARRLKRLHPDIEDREVEVPPAVVAQYHAAKRLHEASKKRMQLAENRLRDRLGNARIATVDGRKVASRSVTEIKERTQTVRAHTRNTLHWSKP